AYKIIRDFPNELMTLLDTYDEIKLNQERYKEFRDKYNSHIKENVYSIETAALFIYLNKHGFNGLFRVNSKGLFNVPWNKKEYVASYNKENILQVSYFLQTVKIINEDFVTSVQNAKKEDFVFFDSPYAPLNSTSFAAYDKSGFKLEDHQRLAALFKHLDTKGVYCMLTNHNTKLINNLYKGYHIEEVNDRRSINSDASKRTGKELIITNYKGMNNRMEKNLFFKNDGVSLYLGDSFELLKKMQQKSVDMIFADPPYFLSSGGITNSGGRMVSVNKGDWDKRLTVEDKHLFNREW